MTSKLRVLHVIGGGEFGGAEQHILNLLTSFSKKQVEAAVVCFYDALFARKLREAGIKVTTLHTYGRFDFRILQGLKQEIIAMNPDIVHTHGVKANFLGRLATRSLDCTTFTTVHSNLKYDYVSPLASFGATLMEKQTRRWTDHFITVSKALQTVLIEDGIPQEKTSVIFNGMDITPFRIENKAEVRATLREEWEIPADAFVFGNVGRIVQIKGLPYLLEAFAQVLASTQNHSNLYLAIIGDGVDRPALEDQARQLGIAERVRFVGFRTDVPRCLQALDMYVHAALYEGLGYTIAEGMAASLPVIATDVGGVGEFVISEETGLLVPPAQAGVLAQAMLRLWQDHKLQLRLVNNSTEMIDREFTIEQMAEQTIHLYKQKRKP
ncbi:glycosyl transferases group 1 family protein [Brevibacillus laterosporus GI-9]|uniref:glycosyltransferase n=1 Tax=Brevibacillus laterosporus TaxID=1465 RepID=UPI000240427C|nr:glycosyltransferase [Brevibacillus laterosporus]CCF12231.1 glycosyl transferases group 1 family protein [Brevibacillus laterosporus GI-9]